MEVLTEESSSYSVFFSSWWYYVWWPKCWHDAQNFTEYSYSTMMEIHLRCRTEKWKNTVFRNLQTCSGLTHRFQSGDFGGQVLRQTLVFSIQHVVHWVMVWKYTRPIQHSEAKCFFNQTCTTTTFVGKTFLIKLHTSWLLWLPLKTHLVFYSFWLDFLMLLYDL